MIGFENLEWIGYNPHPNPRTVTEPIVSAKGSNGTVYQSGVVSMRTPVSSSTGKVGDGYRERLHQKFNFSQLSQFRCNFHSIECECGFPQQCISIHDHTISPHMHPALVLWIRRHTCMDQNRQKILHTIHNRTNMGPKLLKVKSKGF